LNFAELIYSEVGFCFYTASTLCGAAERLVNLPATFCILSGRIFWLTMIDRATRQPKPRWHSRRWKSNSGIASLLNEHPLTQVGHPRYNPA
jgi:hypothetical protein